MSRPQFRTLTAALLGAQAFFGLVAGLALLRFARHHPRRGLAGVGLLTLGVAVGLVVVAVGVARIRSWARPSGLVLEGLVGLGGLTRIGVRPLAALLDIALAVAVAVLLARPDDPGGRPAVVADPPYPGATVERPREPPGAGVDDAEPAGYLRQLAWPFRPAPAGPHRILTESA